MKRVELLRELDKLALKDEEAHGIVPGMGLVRIELHGVTRKQRYYWLYHTRTTGKALYHVARKLDAKDGLQALLAKCCHESALDELREKREALHEDRHRRTQP